MKIHLTAIFQLYALLTVTSLIWADANPGIKQDRPDVRALRGADQQHQPERQVRTQPAQPRKEAEPRQKGVDQVRKPLDQHHKEVDSRGSPSRQVEKRSDNKGSVQHQQQTQFTPRSPSMSRTTIVPNQAHGRTNVQTPRSDTIRSRTQQFVKQNNPQHINTADAAKRGEELRSSFPERVRTNKDSAQRVSSRIRSNHPDYHRWFNNDFFYSHRNYPVYWRNNIDWWRGSHWSRVYRWLGWSPVIVPIYYYNGYPIQINTNISSEGAYDNSSEQISGDWLPIGTFAIGSDVSQAANANLFIQMAVNRQGDLAGIYYNSSTNQTYPLEGVVDQESQQAYWRQTNEITAPVMSTGVYNLTQDVVDVQLTFPGGIVQNWSLVRIE